jgi:hypothetical protein
LVPEVFVIVVEPILAVPLVALGCGVAVALNGVFALVVNHTI